jgi:hypothetical protein
MKTFTIHEFEFNTLSVRKFDLADVLLDCINHGFRILLTPNAQNILMTDQFHDNFLLGYEPESKVWVALPTATINTSSYRDRCTLRDAFAANTCIVLLD